MIVVTKYSYICLTNVAKELIVNCAESKRIFVLLLRKMILFRLLYILRVVTVVFR